MYNTCIDTIYCYIRLFAFVRRPKKFYRVNESVGFFCLFLEYIIRERSGPAEYIPNIRYFSPAKTLTRFPFWKLPQLFSCSQRSQVRKNVPHTLFEDTVVGLQLTGSDPKHAIFPCLVFKIIFFFYYLKFVSYNFMESV